MNSSTPSFRIVRDAGEPLGLFFRVGKSDHTVLKLSLRPITLGERSPAKSFQKV